MKLALIILALTVAVSAAPKDSKLGFRNLYKNPSTLNVNKPNPHIIGGHEATPHSIPYQAFLEVYSEGSGWYCGGSLISQNYVLTAGHCGEDAVEALVTLGAHRALEEEDTQVKLVSNEITVHEDYDSVNIVNDIAAIRLPSSVHLTNAIQPIALPTASDNDYVGTLTTASGWGLTDGHGDTLSEVLNFVQLIVISNEDCETVYGPLESSIVCTSGLDNTGTCSGDSGGPLVTDGALIGIVSFGVEYCPDGMPSAFSRITSFIDWIAENTDVLIV